MPVKRSARDDAGAARQAGESRAEARQSREAARAVRPERKPGQMERASAAGRNRGGLEIGRGTSSQSNRLWKKGGSYGRASGTGAPVASPRRKLVRSEPGI